MTCPCCSSPMKESLSLFYCAQDFTVVHKAEARKHHMHCFEIIAEVDRTAVAWICISCEQVFHAVRHYGTGPHKELRRTL